MNKIFKIVSLLLALVMVLSVSFVVTADSTGVYYDNDNSLYVVDGHIKTKDKISKSVNDYYSVSNGSYTRNSKRFGGSYYDNVALIYSDETYYQFDLEFDITIPNIATETAIEQAFWVTLGEKSKSDSFATQKTTGMTAIGFICSSKNTDGVISSKIVANSLTNLSADGWYNGPTNFDRSKTHHVRVTVNDDTGSNKAYVYFDYATSASFSVALDSSYSGGYIGVAAAYEGVEISNIKTNQSFMTTDLVTNGKTAYPVSNYYTITETGYTRLSRGEANNNFKSMQIYTGEKYTAFTYDFDITFPAGKTGAYYSWITFGETTKTTSFGGQIEQGMNVIALVKSYNNAFLRADYFTSASASSQVNGSARATSVDGATNHVKLAVYNGKAYVYIDGILSCEFELSSTYNGGYISVGSSRTGITFSNIEANEYTAQSTYLSKQINGGTEKTEANALKYYDIRGNKYIRNTTSANTESFNNVPMIYTDRKYSSFTLDFDVTFSDTNTDLQTLWITLGEASKTDHYANQKLTGMGIIGLFRPSIASSTTVNMYSNSWTNAQRDAYPGGPSGVDGTATHHIKVVVAGDGYAKVYWNGEAVYYSTKLDTSYKNGYIGIGAGYSDVEFSNIEIEDYNVEYGDINYDDEITILDYISMKKAISSQAVYFAEADVTKDGAVIDGNDLIEMTKYLLGVITNF